MTIHNLDVKNSLFQAQEEFKEKDNDKNSERSYNSKGSRGSKRSVRHKQYLQ